MSAFEGLTIQPGNADLQGRVQKAIASASRRTGVDFGYLMGQAKIESALNPTARAQTSSATGLYQFIDQSWLGIVNDHGANYGMDWAANAIKKSDSGRYYVSDPQVRQQILDLRNHPETASVMAAELASDNRDYLEDRTGRRAEPVDLYLAHFLGAGGAAKFLTSMASAPATPAANLFPAAARANASVFYDKQGNARSLTDIRQSFAQKLASGAISTDGAATKFAGNASANDVQPIPAGARTVLPADYLRIAQAMNPQSQSALNGAHTLMALAEPDSDADGATGGTDDMALLTAVQAQTLGRTAIRSDVAHATDNDGAPARSLANNIAPRAEAARLAYLMLATLGR